MKKTLLGIMVGTMMVFSQCQQQNETDPVPKTIESIPEELAQAAQSSSCEMDCNNKPFPNCFSSPKNECTGGVREWKGGRIMGDGTVQKGVPWGGDAWQWWELSKNFSCVTRTQEPQIGSIIVFDKCAANKGHGHVGIVYKIEYEMIGNELYKRVYFYDRHFGEDMLPDRHVKDEIEKYWHTKSEYIANVPGTKVLGYINYKNNLK